VSIVYSHSELASVDKGRSSVIF